MRMYLLHKNDCKTGLIHKRAYYLIKFSILGPYFQKENYHQLMIKKRKFITFESKGFAFLSIVTFLPFWSVY